ncbi:MAG: hypothetical protein C5B43_01645 [Verrucomicrobia bacterium]|nr:MAG: hypothetical protein C5B43_01645 [Verrucomicrobiota bacterium]
MFSKLFNKAYKNSYVFSNLHGVATFYNTCMRRVYDAYHYYSFDCRQKSLIFSNNQWENQQSDNDDVVNSQGWEGRSRRNGQGWDIAGWVTVVVGVLTYFLMTRQVNAQEKEVEDKEIEDVAGVGQAKVVTRDNFKEVCLQLKEDDPAITSLGINFVLTEGQLQELYEVIQGNTEVGYISWHEDQFPSSEVLKQIETKLIEHNKNYRYHPTDYVHGLLSKHVYDNSKEGDIVSIDANVDEHLKYWRVEKVFDDTQGIKASGYYAIIYKNDKTHQVVLAVRGTELGVKNVIEDLFKTKSDLKTNLDEVLGGQIVMGQQARNHEATQKAIEIAKKAGYRLSFTGHSLGAWLAELSLFYCYAWFDFRRTKAVTFDSPGTVPMMQKLQSNNIARGTHVKLEDLEIVSYLASPNPVNCCNAHVGKIYRIEVDMPWTKWFSSKVDNMSSPIKVPIDAVVKNVQGGFAIEGHRISTILATFDPATGKPKECKRMLDWPAMEFTGGERTFANQGKAVAKEFTNNKAKSFVDGKIAGLPVDQKALVKQGVEKGVDLAFDCLVGDSTLMTIIGFLKSYFNDEIKRDQYWAYFSYIDLEKEGDINPEHKTKMSYDREFALNTLAKYKSIEDNHLMEPTTGSIDKYLFNLYESEELLKKDVDLPKAVKTQLENLLSSFRIDYNGQQYTLVANRGYNVENILQATRRLLDVLPKNVRKIWQKVATHKHETVVQVIVKDGKIQDQTGRQVPDNLSWQIPYHTNMDDIEKDLEEKLKKDQIVVISGIGGMGKSTLATKYGKDCKQRGWEVRWIKGTEIDEEFFRLAKDLNIKTTNLDPEKVKNLVYTQGFEKHYEGQKLLLIFDKVKDKEKIKEYLTNLPSHAKVIITSRNSNLLLGIPGMSAVELEGFSKREAITYLMKALKKKDEKEVLPIVETVKTSPFRLSKVIDYLEKHPTTTIEEYIRYYKEIFRGRNQDEEIYPEVELLFRDVKHPKSRQLLEYLACLDLEGVSWQLISNIMDEPKNKLEIYINELKQSSLIKVDYDKKTIILSHKNVQREMKRVLYEKDKTHITRALETIISELDNVLPNNDNNCNGAGGAGELVKHAKRLIKEAKKENLAIISIENLLNKVGAYYYKVVFDYKEAILYWDELLKYQQSIHKNNPNHPEIANSLNKLSRVYESLGGEENINHALKYQKEALKMREALFSGDHPDRATSLNDLGCIYQRLEGEKNIRKGLRLQKEALKMRQSLYSGNHPDIAKSLNDMGYAYRKLGGEKNLQKSLKYQNEALIMRQALFPGNHLDVATSLNNVGHGYKRLKGEENFQKGLEYIDKALKMLQALFPGNHPDVASLLCNAGVAHLELSGTDNIQKGFGYLQDSLTMYRALLPADHPLIANSLHFLGRAHLNLGGKANMQKGLEYTKEALAMRQKLFPGNNLDISHSFNNIGLFYTKFGGRENLEYALKCHKKALEIRLAILPRNDPYLAQSLNNIRVVYKKLGGKENIQQELFYAKRCLEVRENLFPENLPDVANALDYVGLAYQKLGGKENVQKSLNYQKKCLEMRQALFPGHHPDVATILHSIGVTYIKLGGKENIQEGLRYQKDALRMRQNLFTNDHLDIAKSFNALAATYKKIGGQENILQSLRYQEDALIIWQKLYPSNSLIVALSLNNLAMLYAQLGDKDKSLEYRKQAYSIYTNLSKEDSKEAKKAKLEIELLQPDFFKNQNVSESLQENGGNKVGSEYRSLITSRGEINDHLIKLKGKIQKEILNNIIESAYRYGWTYWWLTEYGVKGYIEKSYLNGKLGELGNDDRNFEIAQMLCFEAINLGIMKSEKKQYEVVKNFTRENPELVEKIAVEHPEFFVDGSIVEACAEAMPGNEKFADHIYKHVKYTGMEERREAGLIFKSV